MREMKASFAFCDPAFRGVADRELLARSVAGERRFHPVAETVGLVDSLHEHGGTPIA
ncbi:MAG: hypothetical protein J0L64_12210 [Acidobacteria bacterium]|nr:hypothetical protein [Acidobacteriota bacterium]